MGGGFLTIEEFIDIYTPIELDRLERQDPMKRSMEKVGKLGWVTHDQPFNGLFLAVRSRRRCAEAPASNDFLLNISDTFSFSIINNQ